MAKEELIPFLAKGIEELKEKLKLKWFIYFYWFKSRSIDQD